MIPADHITIDGDRAWLVVSSPVDAQVAVDRPCDICGGEHLGLPGDDPRSMSSLCVCHGTGRHCFTIEVDVYGTGYGLRALTVHVVPGMVLPILDADQYEEGLPPAVWLANNLDTGIAWHDGGSYDTLPPAAAPGMFAVMLQVVDA